jgi:hypothetical protein
MNKDAILATVIGFLVGACITSAILFGPMAAKSLSNFRWPKLPVLVQKNAGGNTVLTNPLKEESGSDNQTSITSGITKPEDQAIIKEKFLTVSGRAPAGAQIVIVSPSDETVAEADAQGQYQTEIQLKEGFNKITVIYADGGKTVAENLEIFQTEESL